MGVAVALHEVVQGDAVDELHGHEILSADFTEMVSLDDIRVNQIRDQTSFTDKVAAELFDLGIFFTNEFDRDAFGELAGSVLKSIVNDPHATRGNYAGELEVKFVEDVFELAHCAPIKRAIVSFASCFIDLARKMLEY